MIISTPYELGDIVYMKIDVDQNEMMITGFNVRQRGITYELSRSNGSTSWHYDFEFTLEKSVLKQVQ